MRTITSLVGFVLIAAFPMAAMAENKLTFPHVAVGGEYRMSFFVYNGAEVQEQTEIACFRSDGSSWPLTVRSHQIEELDPGEGVPAPFSFSVPPQGIVELYAFGDLGGHPKAANEGHLKTGQRN